MLRHWKQTCTNAQSSCTKQVINFIWSRSRVPMKGEEMWPSQARHVGSRREGPEEKHSNPIRSNQRCQIQTSKPWTRSEIPAADEKWRRSSAYGGSHCQPVCSWNLYPSTPESALYSLFTTMAREMQLLLRTKRPTWGQWYDYQHHSPDKIQAVPVSETPVEITCNFNSSAT